jgi:hypothetical protein
MKKVLLAGLIAISLSTVLSGCGAGGSKKMFSSVPTSILNEFNDMYPSARDIKWKNKDGLYQADFKVGKEKMEAAFTPDGDFVRSDM